MNCPRQNKHAYIEGERHGELEVQESEQMVEEKLMLLTEALNSIQEKEMFQRAESECPSYVNSRGFRLMFLRAELFDAEKAAERMVLYWEEKYKLFGEEHTFEPLSLNSLTDGDKETILVGGVRALPHMDDYGRGIAFIDRTKWPKGQRNRTMRALWYTTHVLVENNESVQQKGVVPLAASRSMLRVQDFDRLLTKRMLVHCQEVLPLRMPVFHHIIRSSVVRMLMPYVYFLMGRELRKRYVPYTGTDMQIRNALAENGIGPEKWPVEAGGMLELFDGCAWLKERTNKEIGVVFTGPKEEC